MGSTGSRLDLLVDALRKRRLYGAQTNDPMLLAFSGSGVPDRVGGIPLSEIEGGGGPVAFADLTGKPTTIAGYGITDTRELLSADRTYYVRTDGSDSNNGLANTAGGAFLTIQKPLDVVQNELDLADYILTIRVADGTYDEYLTLSNLVSNLVITSFGGAPWPVRIIGNTTTPANVKIRPTLDPPSFFAVSVSGRGILSIDGVEIDPTAVAGEFCGGIEASLGGRVLVGDADEEAGNNSFKGTVGDWIYCNASGPGSMMKIQAEGRLDIDGDGYVFLFAAEYASATMHGSSGAAKIHFLNTPAFSLSVLAADFHGFINWVGAWDGVPTGRKYFLCGQAELFFTDITLPGDASGESFPGSILGKFGGDLALTGFAALLKSGVPANTDIPTDTWGVFKNSVDSKVYLAINDGGTIKKVELT